MNKYLPLENYLHSQESNIIPDYVKEDIESLLSDFKDLNYKLELRNNYIVERCLKDEN